MCHFFSLFAHLFTRIFHCELREMVRQKVDVPFGMAHFDLSYNLILFLRTTSLRWIDYIFSLALRFIYNCRGDFIFWRFWSFFLWSHEISTKLGHISFEEYAEAPSISLQHESVHRLKFSNFQYLNGICSYLCNIFRKENSPFNICF